MRNINDVLAEKQREMYELKKQIDILLLAAPLLSEQGDPPLPPPPQPQTEGAKRWP